MTRTSGSKRLFVILAVAAILIAGCTAAVLFIENRILAELDAEFGKINSSETYEVTWEGREVSVLSRQVVLRGVTFKTPTETQTAQEVRLDFTDPFRGLDAGRLTMTNLHTEYDENILNDLPPSMPRELVEAFLVKDMSVMVMDYDVNRETGILDIPHFHAEYPGFCNADGAFKFSGITEKIINMDYVALETADEAKLKEMLGSLTFHSMKLTLQDAGLVERIWDATAVIASNNSGQTFTTAGFKRNSLDAMEQKLRQVSLLAPPAVAAHVDPVVSFLRDPFRFGYDISMNPPISFLEVVDLGESNDKAETMQLLKRFTMKMTLETHNKSEPHVIDVNQLIGQGA